MSEFFNYRVRWQLFEIVCSRFYVRSWRPLKLWRPNIGRCLRSSSLEDLLFSGSTRHCEESPDLSKPLVFPRWCSCRSLIYSDQILNACIKTLDSTILYFLIQKADCPCYLRLSEEESSSLLDLITCKAPATAAGVKFVSLGLCMFIACNSLISTPESEKRAVAWIHWLVEQAAHFEQVC